MGGKDLLDNKGLQERFAGQNLCGIKDSILDAFASRDFAQVMRLADLLDLQESSASDFGKDFDKDSSENSSGNRDENCGGDCSEDSSDDFGEDFISAGAKELGEFTSSVIALSALEVAKATQAIGKITKQAVIFAKIALKAHKASQDKSTQNDSLQDKSTQNGQNKGTQHILCDENSQDKMAFYDLTLAKAYASNGDIAHSKEILQNLAKPFLDFALQSAEANAMDFGFVDWIKSYIDENIGGGGR